MARENEPTTVLLLVALHEHIARGGARKLHGISGDAAGVVRTYADTVTSLIELTRIPNYYSCSNTYLT